MLQLKDISKQYKTGSYLQEALNNVCLNLRDNEFVSILGPSGSGKTTLLNIIGGLDRYDSGDLIINGTSTKRYGDRDWDSYRNHTIGFVFQSYNLIPHQTILANVELALTISGISRSERRRRARKALEEVGLGEQLHKKPNQMSGGQMQRVAIARALVNDPDILLADEPTGALDTETSLQVMELLESVASDRLVVMVTHNSELAQRYSSRIIKLRDGKVTDDSNPFLLDKETITGHRNTGKAKMSFMTSLSLSFNNLRTKKGRTILTSFAGSIGIIGIALILALSTGVNNYISDIQKDTMTSYPITISSEAIDIAGMMQAGHSGGNGNQGAKNSSDEEEKTAVYADYSDIESRETIASSIKENNLTAFKEYLDDSDSEILQYLGENGVVYNYNVDFDVYSYDAEGKLVNTDTDTQEAGVSVSGGFGIGGNNMEDMMGGVSASPGAENFSELMAGADGTSVSQVITDSYEVLYGEWPQDYNEVVLVLDENNSVPAASLYQLGLITADEYEHITEQIRNKEERTGHIWDYEEICSHTFYMIPACDYYQENEEGIFHFVGDDLLETASLLENSTELKITGVVRPVRDAANANISTPIAYTTKMTDYIIEHTNESPVVTAQETSPETNILNGMGFAAADDTKKLKDAKEYISNLGISDKASLYMMVLYNSPEVSKVINAVGQGLLQSEMSSINLELAKMGETEETIMAQAMDTWLEETPDDDMLLTIYEEYIEGATYEENLKKFGKVSYDAPEAISIYTDSFEDKDAVSACIEDYNQTADEADRITYTDYVALLTGSITSIINAISYVLIAFVAVSLIVSCIMIGIITHISVLERTKEIGILRALGASKYNISQVFNAETIIIGLFAGILGVAVSTLLTFPINSIIKSILGAETMRASLPVSYAVILTALSIVITVIGGLLPARKAARKDPVIALRTE